MKKINIDYLITFISAKLIYLHLIFFFFKGNITEKAPDTMIRQILSACGPVVSWKRVSAFGFCEFRCVLSRLRTMKKSLGH